MGRWLLLPLGLGIAAIAAYAILSGPAQHVASPPPDAGAPHSSLEGENVEGKNARARESAPPTPVQHPEIRDESRDQLREILRGAESEKR